MNKSNAKDYLPIVQALADGKVIQRRAGNLNGEWEWVDWDEPDFSLPARDYRIKPKPFEVYAVVDIVGWKSNRFVFWERAEAERFIAQINGRLVVLKEAQ